MARWWTIAGAIAYLQQNTTLVDSETNMLIDSASIHEKDQQWNAHKSYGTTKSNIVTILKNTACNEDGEFSNESLQLNWILSGRY